MEQVNTNFNELLVSQKSQATTLFSLKSILTALVLSASYLLLSYLLVGFRTDQLVLVGLFNLFYFGSKTTRRFILSFSIFILYWIIFDYMKAFPNYTFNPVHIESLYMLEKNFFGIAVDGQVLTPNEYFIRNSSTVLDLLSGVFYLCWIPVPLLFASALYFINRSYFFQFSFSFFLVNIIGFVGYYLYPAAPPWYVLHHGFEFHAATPGNTAGLARFDEMTGLPIFQSLYAKSSNVFAAMPSLHAAYMMIVVYYAGRLRWHRLNIAFVTITLGIWFSAVYSAHHYLLDVLAGAACAVAGIALFQYALKTPAGRRLFEKLL